MWLEFWVSIYNLIFLGLLAMGVRIRQNACAFKALVLAFGPQGFLTPQHTICKKFLNIFQEKLGFHPWRTSANFCCQDFSCLYQTKLTKCCFPWRVGCRQCKAQIGCHKSKQLDSIDGVQLMELQIWLPDQLFETDYLLFCYVHLFFRFCLDCGVKVVAFLWFN